MQQVFQKKIILTPPSGGWGVSVLCAIFADFIKPGTEWRILYNYYQTT